MGMRQFKTRLGRAKAGEVLVEAAMGSEEEMAEKGWEEKAETDSWAGEATPLSEEAATPPSEEAAKAAKAATPPSEEAATPPQAAAAKSEAAVTAARTLWKSVKLSVRNTQQKCTLASSVYPHQNTSMTRW